MSIQERLMKKSPNSEEAITTEILVDMHLHSSFSDGALSPEQIAEKLSFSDVKYAALTDHNTLDGLPSFRRALMRFGIGYVSGVEITTKHKDYVLHLLAYGFEPDFHELRIMLTEKVSTAPLSQSNQKIFRTSHEIIELIHRSGGIAVLAHPIQTEPVIEKVRVLVRELKDLGLDGIEAIYGPNSLEKEACLLEIATMSNLLITAGTDYHEANGIKPGIKTDIKDWKTFRDALLRSYSNAIQSQEFKPIPVEKRKKSQWFSFLRNIILPAFLTLALFVIALSVFLLPYFEETLMERKRENIRQLTQVAWGVLNEAVEEVENGQLSLEQAQTLAKNRVSAMRYGPENKDYFWIQDASPKILMHPYRTELNNQDVSDFKDAQGNKIFVEFANLVAREGEGYISYVWQWKDEPDRLEPKESYIRLFEPWGWIIGTGIYVNDVQAEIDNLQSYIVRISVIVIFIIFGLLLYLIKQGKLLENSRTDAEKLLLEATERYRALSEAATEGALFVYDGRCRYANTVMYEMLGCSLEKIELLDLNDVFPDIEVNKNLVNSFLKNSENFAPNITNVVVKRCDGTLLDCNLTVKNGLNNPKSGCMILLRRSVDLSEQAGSHVALNRLLRIPGNIASELADSIKNALNINEVAALSKKTSGLVASLLENGTSSLAIAYMISTISDLVAQRIIELNINKIGKPPVHFAFLALGSHGRQSQTLFSDQDNAIVYETIREENAKDVQNYFLKLASMVCDDLEKAGYKKCIGNMIASNPKWCQPLSVWKSYFAEWIRNPEPQQIVEFSILFDFRPISGTPELAAALREFIYSGIQNDAFFLTRIAQNALRFKTPMRLFGSILSFGGKGIDVKRPVMAIVGFARLYAMKNSITETNTLLQIDALKSLGIILDSKHRNIVTAFETLVRLRLWNQVMTIEKSIQFDDYVERSQLGNMEEVILRESFREIDELQGFIQRDFAI